MKGAAGSLGFRDFVRARSEFRERIIGLSRWALSSIAASGTPMASSPTSYEAGPLRVFLCHASEDKPIVHELYRMLEARGFDPWLDSAKLKPGQDWQYEIRKAVRRSDAVVVFLSQHSVTKEGFVQKEIRYVLDVADEKPPGTVFIIPIKLDEAEVPDRFQSIQYLRYVPHSPSACAPCFDILVSVLNERRETLRRPPVSDGQDSFLLSLQEIRTQLLIAPHEWELWELLYRLKDLIEQNPNHPRRHEARLLEDQIRRAAVYMAASSSQSLRMSPAGPISAIAGFASVLVGFLLSSAIAGFASVLVGFLLSLLFRLGFFQHRPVAASALAAVCVLYGLLGGLSLLRGYRTWAWRAIVVVMIGILIAETWLMWRQAYYAPVSAVTSSKKVRSGPTANQGLTGQALLASKGITVDSPPWGALVTSPLTVAGRAPTTWFHEAEIDLVLQDSANRTLANVPAKAQGDWTARTGTVPFRAVLSFVPTTFQGMLVIQTISPMSDRKSVV